MSDTVTLSFGELITAAIDERKASVIPISASVFERHHHGVLLRLPTFQAAITAGDVTPNLSEAAAVPLTWLSGGRNDQIERRLNFVPVASEEGEIPFGNTLPTALMVSERGSPFVDGTAQALSESAYKLRYIEAKAGFSNQVLLQSDLAVMDGIENGLRQASRDLLIDQLLAGSGQGREMQGALSLALSDDNQSAYASVGSDLVSAVLTAEEMLTDNDASPDGLAWALGTALHTYMRRAVLEPGSGEHLVQNGRVFSGIPAVRSKALEANTGILLDARNALVLPVSVEGELYVNRVSRPGETRLTMRTHATTTWTRPELVYRLTQA